jgi:flagellar hook-associated protein 2
MYSGIDTDGLVKALTMNQQAKVDKLNAQVKQAEWKRDLLTDFNNKIRIFRDTFGSTLGSDNLMSRGAFMSFSVKMEANSGVSVLASASAKAGNYNIRVDQIATASTMQGVKLTDRVTGLTDAEVNTMGIGRLNAPGRSDHLGDFDFTINGKEFSFSATDSLKKVMDEVNKSGAGVTMSYTQSSDRITVTGNGMGSESSISVTDTSGFLAHLGLTEVTAGQDAIVYLNGSDDPLTISSNSVTLDGINISFLRPTDENGVDYTLESDHNPALSRIKSMVSSFNELFSSLSEAHEQRPSRDYRPLTADQRAEMSDREIEDWEARAKQGLLHRDNTLGRLVNNMRGLLSRTFGDAGTLASIGITTGRYRVGETAQLEIDEEKLLAALQSDPDRVYNLLSAIDNGGSDGGFMTQLNKMTDNYVNSIKGRDLQNLNNNIHNYTKNIKEQEDKLMVMSEKYYLQYAKLETALGEMTAQQEWLSSMFGWGQQ